MHLENFYCDETRTLVLVYTLKMENKDNLLTYMFKNNLTFLLFTVFVVTIFFELAKHSFVIKNN